MKFSIRDLLWLTVVVALGAAWWVDRSRLALENRRLMVTPARPYYTLGPAPDFLSPHPSAPVPRPSQP